MITKSIRMTGHIPREMLHLQEDINNTIDKYGIPLFDNAYCCERYRQGPNYMVKMFHNSTCTHEYAFYGLNNDDMDKALIKDNPLEPIIEPLIERIRLAAYNELIDLFESPDMAWKYSYQKHKHGCEPL